MKRFYKDERGSSLVLTIIAIAFISLLAVAVIAMTVTNIRLKIAQKGSQKNFYTTDSIMDEVRAGVEDMAASASVKAYMEAFSSYGASVSGATGTLTDKYNKKFLETMITTLSGGKSSYGDASLYYKDEVLQGYLIANGANPDRYLPHDGNGENPSGVAFSGKNYGYLEMQNETLLLKDVRITMTESGKSYKTTLTSDIRVTIPAMTTDTHSEYLNYAMIADNQIIANVSGSVAVEGNMYAGTVRRFDTPGTVEETGILIGNGTTLNVKAEQVVTRGDLFIHGGSTFELKALNGMTANLWVENIFTSPKDGGGNTMTIDGTCNVSDDMEIGGENDNVTLTGNYYGYNYNNNYTSSDIGNVSSESQYSSAILINGLGSNLNIFGLNQLILSGRTFISKKTNVGEYDERTPSVTNKPIINADIAMGESLTVKGAQIAYYVPTDFVKTAASDPTFVYPVVNKTDKTIKFCYSTDPGTEVTFDYGAYLKYLFGLDPKTATDAELNAKLNSSFDFTTYLAGTPLTTYYRNDKTVEANSVTYYYLNFLNETKLLEFYPWFAGAGSSGATPVPRYSSVKDTNAAYMGATGISLNEGMHVLGHSGHLLFKDGVSGNMKVRLKNESVSVDSSALRSYATVKTKEYLSRQLALSPNCDEADQAVNNGQFRLLNNSAANLSKSGTADDTNLYDVLIDSTKMPATTVEQLNGSGDGVIIIEPDATSTYVWDSSKKVSTFGGKSSGIIIAAGDVEVEDNFSGLILAGGDISLKASGIKVTSDSELLEKMFTEDKNETPPIFFDLFSKYFRKVLNASIGQDADATKDVVIYEKWKKK